MSARAVALVAAALVLGAAGCGGDDAGPERPALDQIAPAIAATELELGGAQQYFEINATPQAVNLFVADAAAAAVTPFVYVGGSLAETGPAASATGNTFAASALAFDAATVLDGVIEALPDSDIVSFSIAGGPGGAVQYTARVQSDAGGELDVVLAPDGSTVSIDPVTG